MSKETAVGRHAAPPLPTRRAAAAWGHTPQGTLSDSIGGGGLGFRFDLHHGDGWTARQREPTPVTRRPAGFLTPITPGFVSFIQYVIYFIGLNEGNPITQDCGGWCCAPVHSAVPRVVTAARAKSQETSREATAGCG